MGIDSIKLKNFQPHKDTSIRFSTSITIITGGSDRGKSSVIRAIRWVLINDLPLNAVINKDSKEASVSLVVNGHSIIRNTQGNSYVIDGVRDSVVGKNVPDKVPQMMQMLADCIQSQYDNLYCLPQSGAAFNSVLNALSKLDIITGWVSGVNKDNRQVSSELKATLEALEGCKSELDRNIEIRDTLSPKYAELSALLVTYKLLRSKQADVSGILQDIVDVSPLQAVYTSLSGMINRYAELGSKYQDLQQLIRQSETTRQEESLLQNRSVVYQELLALYEKADKLRQYQSALKDYITYTKDIAAFQDRRVVLSGLCVLYERYVQVKSKKDELSCLLGIITGTEHLDLQSRLSVLTQQLSNSECPLCGSRSIHNGEKNK